MQKIKQDISIGENMKELRERGGYNVAVSILITLKRIYKVPSFDLFFENL